MDAIDDEELYERYLATGSRLLASDTPERQEALDTFDHVENLLARVRLPEDLAQATDATLRKKLAEAGYQILDVLGEGGFGRVYLACDERLQRQVALKVPRPLRWAAVRHQQHFLEEARLAAKLNHPGIVTLHDVVVDDHHCLLVTEYVEGGTLENMLRNGPLSAERAAQLTEQLAEAIAHAHQHNVVHRDLKPHNILIDKHGRPRITDFGVAIRDDEQGATLGQVAGTLNYMAPEQTPGEREFVDGRADIWSLGVILYRMLTGQLPFHGADSTEVAHEIRTRDPKPLRQLRPEIPPELQRICTKCLAKDANQRYLSAADLAVDLQRFLASANRKHRWMWPLGLALAIAVPALFLLLGRLRLEGPAPSAPTSPTAAAGLADALSIQAMQVHHYRPRSANSDDVVYFGTIETNSGGALYDDEIRLGIKFNQPAYFYLIEFTSLGDMQLHYPHSRQAAPSERMAVVEFPLTSSNDTLRLNDGVGTHAFVAIGSLAPLPSFEQWLSDVGMPPWSQTADDGVWVYTNEGVRAQQIWRQRASLQQHVAPPAVFGELCTFLSAQSDGIAIRAVAFSVKPAPRKLFMSPSAATRDINSERE